MDDTDFLTRLYRSVPDTPGTRVLVVLNLAIFVPMALSAGALVQIPAEVLLRWGGNDARLTLAGEVWRLMSAVFLHGGLLHVVLNMLALHQAGQLVERMFGMVRFLVLYLGAGILASVTSVWWRQDAVSVGASGAIFGIFGALLAYLLLHRRSLPREAYARMRSTTLSFIGYSLLIGFAAPGIDNAAHLGGLLGGALLGWSLAAAQNMMGRLRQLAGAVAVASLAVLLWFAAERPPPPSGAIELLAASQPLLLSREHEILEALRAGTLAPAEALDIVDRELRPNWDRLVLGLEGEQGRGDWRGRELLQYARLERSSLEALSLGLSTGHPRWLATAAALRAEARQLLAQSAGRTAGTGKKER